MSERLNNHESKDKSHEALDEAHSEKSAELERTRERAAEKAAEQSIEKTSRDALEAATKAEKQAKAEKAPAEKRRDTPAQRRARQKASFNITMKETQAQMPALSRSFSKIIHNKAVEKTSEVVGSTVARPNAILTGSVAAFVLTLGIYLVAKYYGYPLSGFETIAAFIIGWAVGLLFDYLRVMITGKRV